MDALNDVAESCPKTERKTLVLHAPVCVHVHYYYMYMYMYIHNVQCTCVCTCKMYSMYLAPEHNVDGKLVLDLENGQVLSVEAHVAEQLQLGREVVEILDILRVSRLHSLGKLALRLGVGHAHFRPVQNDLLSLYTAGIKALQ